MKTLIYQILHNDNSNSNNEFDKGSSNLYSNLNNNSNINSNNIISSMGNGSSVGKGSSHAPSAVKVHSTKIRPMLNNDVSGIDFNISSSNGKSRSSSTRRVSDIPSTTISSQQLSLPSATNSGKSSGRSNEESFLGCGIGFSAKNILNSTSKSNKQVDPIAIAPSSSSNTTPATTAGTKKLCCDKCDGNHETDNCPYYKKARDQHPDAQKNFYKKLGGTSILPGALIRSASVVRQPGDGSCLFHSMSYGLKGKNNAEKLRAEICAFIKDNPQLLICETPLSEWVRWDSGSTVGDYARKMSRGSWGGGIEMAVASHIKQVNIHVYEANREGYKRISAFDFPDKPEDKTIVRVLYRGGVHYDALVA